MNKQRIYTKKKIFSLLLGRMMKVKEISTMIWVLYMYDYTIKVKNNCS